MIRYLGRLHLGFPGVQRATEVSTPQWPSWVGRIITIGIGITLLQLIIWGTLLGSEGPGVYVRHHTDFLHILTSGRILRDGNGVHLYDVETQRAAQNRILAPYLSLEPGTLLPFNHPPLEALFITPWMQLPYAALYAAWIVLIMLAVGLSLRLLSTTIPLPPAARWIFITAVASYHPLHIALWSGQSSPFMLLGLCGTYAALRRRRHGWAGASLLLLTLKPQILPILLLLLLVLGEWKSAAIWAGLMGAISVLAMPFLGVAWPLHYLDFVITTSQMGKSAFIDPTHMPTWRGLVANLLGTWPQLITPAFITLFALSLGAFLRAIWPMRPAQTAGQNTRLSEVSRRDLQWALAVIVALLISFHLGPHDFVLFVLPAWIISAYALSPAVARGLSRSLLLLVWLCYALPLLMFISRQSIVLSVIPVALLGGILVWLAISREWSERITASQPESQPQLAGS